MEPGMIHDMKEAAAISPLAGKPAPASLLVDLVRRSVPDARLRRFEFKAMRPTFDGRPLRLNGRAEGKHIALWARDNEGWLAMKASAASPVAAQYPTIFARDSVVVMRSLRFRVRVSPASRTAGRICRSTSA